MMPAALRYLAIRCWMARTLSGVAGWRGLGKTVRRLERLGVAPLMQRFVGIKGEVDHPIDLAFAVVDANGPCLEIDAEPHEGTDLTDPQPAPQHQQKHRAVA
jgi:hypothetical protein